MLHDYSSCRGPLKGFLATRLRGLRRQDRIAGFFSSSLLEVTGEALERMKLEGGEAGSAPGMARFAPHRNRPMQGGEDWDARIYLRWKDPEEQAKGWRAEINEGAKINIAPGERLGMFPVKKIVLTVEMGE